MSLIPRKQRTLGKEVAFSGIGLHTGSQVTMRFLPAKEGTGIVFRRSDLAGLPIIPATVEYVCDTKRSTSLGVGSVRIHTVEHVLAALKAYRVDNLLVDISSIEPPIGNGSSDVFVEMIEEAGLVEQTQTVVPIAIQTPVYHSEGDVHLVALPSEGFRVTYTLSYPGSHYLDGQFFSFLLTNEGFKKEIAPCRTFCLYQELSHLMDAGLIKGGSLDNAVVVKEDAVISKGGLFFPNEMARHKILDLIGDLSLIGFEVETHILAVRSGHPSHFAFAKKLLQHITRETPTWNPQRFAHNP